MYFENSKQKERFGELMTKYNSFNYRERTVLLYIQSSEILMNVPLYEVEDGDFHFKMDTLRDIRKKSSSQQHFIALAWQLWRGSADVPSGEEDVIEWIHRFAITSILYGLGDSNKRIVMQAISLYAGE